jgi:hypothetical protein
MSAIKEPTPAPIAAGKGPATIAKNTGITIPGRNSPTPQGVRRVEVNASKIAYNAAHIAAEATNLELLIGRSDDVNSMKIGEHSYINRGSKISK